MAAMILLIVLFIFVFLVWLDFYLGKKKYRISPPITRLHNGDGRFLPTGHQFFDALFQDIEKAVHHIHIQFYIFREDHIGKKMTSLLMQKAAEGVSIKLLVDYIGSFSIDKKTIQRFKKARIDFAFSNKPGFPFFLYRLNQRNHRKLTIIDGKIGYLGGFNVGDEYLGRDPDLGDWRDYHMRLEGEVVHALQKQFLVDWRRATKELLHMEAYYPKAEKKEKQFLIQPSDGNGVYSFFLRHIQKAEKSIVIGSPYFIPGKEIHRALLDAVSRGVQITILVPKKPDHPLVQEASYPYFKDLLKAGCSIYQFKQGFFHAKAFLVDDELCDIGTANFDLRSFFTNGEINCIFKDHELIQTVKQVLETDFSHSDRLTLEHYNERTFWFKVKECIATAIAPFL